MRAASYFAITLVFLLNVALTGAEPPAKEERHVVLVVWDGMRPDFVTENNTPILWKLAQEGVVFQKHHAVYLPSTHVNGTALETGDYPDHNGVIANYDYRPDINAKEFVSTEQLGVIRKGDEISHGKYISAPTLAELVRANGHRTVVAAAKTIGFLLDRQIDAGAADKGITLSAGESVPRSKLSPIISVIGPIPAFSTSRHGERDSWTTRALTEVLWKEEVPAFSILWLGEPDLTQHDSTLGAPPTLAAIKSSDDNLGVVLAELERQGVRATTDIFVVSDHGFSTIERANDVRKFLRDGGLKARIDFKDASPQRGDVVLVGNGGSVLFYVIDHDKTVIERLIELLQQSDFAGVIFTKKPVAGTFTFDKGQIDNGHVPDVVMAFRWNDARNPNGVPGMIDADWNRRSGKSTHASLSAFDMHNTLVAAGPDFQKGAVDDDPTGNVDLAPTILRILKLKGPAMDGRILSEAMVVPENSLGKTTSIVPEPSKTIEAVREFPMGTWRQYLRSSQVGNTIYLDEGNGSFSAKAK